MSTRPGRVRAARLTDLAALGELSRLAQQPDADTRSLGLPISASPVGMFNLFRLPLGAFRPHDLLYVYEEAGRLAGLLRVERESHRDEWTIVELDAVASPEAGDIRYRLIQHLLRDGARRGAVRFHVACADQAGQRRALHAGGVHALRRRDGPVPRRRRGRCPSRGREAEMRACRIRPAAPLDAIALARLYSAATPMPVQRLEGYRLADWERQGSGWRVPRSSLTPILRFAEVEAYVQEAEGGGRDGTELDGFIQVGVAKEDQPHYLKILVRPGADARPLVRFGLGLIAARMRGAGGRHDHGVMVAVRTYEAPLDRGLEEAGFVSIATVTLLMKETMIRVAEPALVPAVR